MLEPKPTIFVVDDDDAIRDSLSGLFEAEGYATRTFASAEAFLEAGLDHAHGCAILDIQMPGMSGLELQAELTRRGATLPLILLTSHGDVAKAVSALKAGAVDFIEKPFDADDLMRAIHQALSIACTTRRNNSSHSQFKTLLATLTPREREVMDLIVDGTPNKAVAVALGISVRTAEVHRAKVMEKMDCPSLSALIHLVLRNPQTAA